MIAVYVISGIAGMGLIGFGIYRFVKTNGKQKIADENQARDESIKTMKQNLYEQLECDKEARNEMLRNMYGKKQDLQKGEFRKKYGPRIRNTSRSAKRERK